MSKEIDALKKRNDKLGEANKALAREVELRDAMVLNRYVLVPELDKKGALEGATELTKMQQPMAHGWAVVNSGVFEASFTAKSDIVTPSLGKVMSWHGSELVALGAYRNLLARRYAGLLAELDAKIASKHAEASALQPEPPAAEGEQTKAAESEGGARADG